MLLLIDFALCPLPNYAPALSGDILTREELIQHYFEQGFSYQEILVSLAATHGIMISMITLKRVLKRLQLRRRVPVSREQILQTIVDIKNELQGSGNFIGYRAMWRRLQQRGLIVSCNSVREMLRTLDEDGVRERKLRRLKRRMYVNPGPNFVWHIDGYDKLKPFGFAIHGAIDGFSRRIIWAEVGISNNNPKVVAKYFIDAVSQLKTLPAIIRSDRGTENIFVEDLQKTLRAHHGDEFSRKCYLYGKSSSNQRIEAWWRILRQQSMGYYINLFKDMVSQGILDTGNDFHIDALRFSFWELIEGDLHRTAIEWNRHPIQVKKNYEGVKGRPDMLYFNSIAYGSRDHGFPCDPDLLDPILCHLEETHSIPRNHNPDFVKAVNVLLPNWQEPRNTREALTLYGQILQVFNPFL